MNKKWRYVLIFWVVLWGCLKLLQFYFHKTYTKEEIDTFFEPITSKYGIKIVYDIGKDFYSPIYNPYIPAGPVPNSKVTPIRHRVLKRYAELLQTAFAKYPVDVIKNYLNVIQFVGEIEDDVHGSYWGTYDQFRRIIYLSDNGTKDNDDAMGTFHHEFSSLLLARHSFFLNKWTDRNPKDFEYFMDKYDNYKKMKKNREIIKDYYEKGMVANYGLTDFENDFNEYSEMIFTSPQKFKEIMAKYPRVRAKFLIWLEFYQKIDPIFTEEYLLGNS